MPYVRCKNCWQRRTLKLHPDKYYRLPTCTTCHKKYFKGWYVDKYRSKFERGANAPKPCKCYGYSFPHRLGSKFCTNNPNLTADMLRVREEESNWA